MANYALFMFLSFYSLTGLLQWSLRLQLPSPKKNFQQLAANLHKFALLQSFAILYKSICLYISLYISPFVPLSVWLFVYLSAEGMVSPPPSLPFPATVKVFYLKCKVFNNFDYWRRANNLPYSSPFQCQFIKNILPKSHATSSGICHKLFLPNMHNIYIWQTQLIPSGIPLTQACNYSFLAVYWWRNYLFFCLETLFICVSQSLFVWRWGGCYIEIYRNLHSGQTLRTVGWLHQKIW